MQSFKNFLWKLAITAIIWIVSRFVPALIPVLFPVNGLVSVLIMLGALYLSWYIAGTVSKWKYPGTIETNLIILGTLEVFGIVMMLFSLLQSFSSDGALLVFLTIAASAAYVWLCFILRDEAKDRYKTLYGNKDN